MAPDEVEADLAGPSEGPEQGFAETVEPEDEWGRDVGLESDGEWEDLAEPEFLHDGGVGLGEELDGPATGEWLGKAQATDDDAERVAGRSRGGTA